jgi:hypothetical protein
MVRSRWFAPTVLVVALALPMAAACSESEQQDARNTASSIEDDAREQADELGQELDDATADARARAAAEDLRLRIKANDAAEAQGARSVAAITESATDVVGDPEVAGVEDADGDGLDDDGKVQVNVEGASACVTLPATGDDTTVEGGPC